MLMSTRPHGETFTRSDIGNGEALSGARVNGLQCGRTANANSNKVRYTFRAVARTEPRYRSPNSLCASKRLRKPLSA